MNTLDSNLQAVARAKSPDGKLHDFHIDLGDGVIVTIHVPSVLTEAQSNLLLQKLAQLREDFLTL